MHSQRDDSDDSDQDDDEGGDDEDEDAEDADDEMVAYLKHGRREPQHRDVSADRLSSPPSHHLSPAPTSSSSSSLTAAADAAQSVSMATHRMPATLPSTTASKQRHQSAGLMRSQSLSNSDTH